RLPAPHAAATREPGGAAGRAGDGRERLRLQPDGGEDARPLLHRLPVVLERGRVLSLRARVVPGGERRRDRPLRRRRVPAAALRLPVPPPDAARAHRHAGLPLGRRHPLGAPPPRFGVDPDAARRLAGLRRLLLRALARAPPPPGPLSARHAAQFSCSVARSWNMSCARKVARPAFRWLAIAR